MKLTDYVAQFLKKQGIKHVFAVTGGASIHLIHSIAETEGIDYICPAHEQGGAMAADAYARVTGNLGVAISTSGPGATNMITGICCSYFDSVPVLYITGQVTTFRMKGNSGVRQLGFQETDIVDICNPITKYAVTVTNEYDIRFVLEKAVSMAKEGRPGPILIDIPDDIQRADIDPKELKGFHNFKKYPPSKVEYEEIRNYISKAEKPLLIFGGGVRIAKAEKEALKLVNELNIPFTATWAAIDMFPSNHPLYVGSFGTHGTKYGNFAVQTCDLLLTIGTRLDSKATAGKNENFAKKALKILVDIDINELDKFNSIPNTELIVEDAKIFIKGLLKTNSTKKNYSNWLNIINEWKKKYPIVPESCYNSPAINPYLFIKKLSNVLEEDAIIVCDTGCSIGWMMQAFEFKKGQRIIHDFNNTAMGYALPAAIGACLANDRKQVICIIGDGSLQMTINELSTIIKHNLPIKIFCMNNHGYSMVRQTEDQWLNSKHFASTEDDLGFPDFVDIASSYGFYSYDYFTGTSLDKVIKRFKGPVFFNVEIPPEYKVVPQTKFGRNLEDSDPPIPEEELNKIMEGVYE